MNKIWIIVIGFLLAGSACNQNTKSTSTTTVVSDADSTHTNTDEDDSDLHDLMDLPIKK